MPEAETTGTQGQEGGDAGVDTQTAGTPGAEGRDAQSKGDDLTKLNLEWKGKAETLNALFASYGVNSAEELKELLAQSPAAPVDNGTDAGGDDELERGAEEWVGKGDAVAKYATSKIKKLEERIEQLTRGVGDAFAVREIPEAERKAAVAHYQKNRHRLGDVNAALAEIRAPKLAAENARLSAELAKLQKHPDPDVVSAPRTAGREIASTQTNKRKMTLAQATAEADRLRSEGKHHAAMQFLAAAEIEN